MANDADDGPRPERCLNGRCWSPMSCQCQPTGESTMSLSDLIARLEKATGPDRELDAEIAARLSGRKRLGQNFADRSWMGVFEYDEQMGGKSVALAVPRFTGPGIDAAMTLYPVLPARVPSDPRKACIEALRAREAQP